MSADTLEAKNGTLSDTLEITKMLTISTGHVTAKTADLLDAEPFENNLGIPVYEKESYGWFVYIDANVMKTIEQPDFPADLAGCIRLAHENDCSVLCLDQDAEMTLRLPIHEW